MGVCRCWQKRSPSCHQSRRKSSTLLLPSILRSFFDTETFSALIYALADALPKLRLQRRAQDAFGTIHQPVAGVVRTSPPELIELWEMMSAETRRQVEQVVRNSAPKRSATEFLRQLGVLLDTLSPHAKLGRLHTIQRRYLKRVGKIWKWLGLRIGLAYDEGKTKKNRESRFQRFVSLALGAVEGDSVISRRQIGNSKKKLAR